MEGRRLKEEGRRKKEEGDFLSGIICRISKLVFSSYINDDTTSKQHFLMLIHSLTIFYRREKSK